MRYTVTVLPGRYADSYWCAGQKWEKGSHDFDKLDPKVIEAIKADPSDRILLTDRVEKKAEKPDK